MSKLIAIVDDNKDFREVLAHILVRQGYDTTPVPNGLKLVSLLHVDKPALILLDIRMEWIDGIHLCKAIKENENFRDIPIILMSAYADETTESKSLAVGACAFYRKSRDSQALINKIREILGDSNGE